VIPALTFARDPHGVAGGRPGEVASNSANTASYKTTAADRIDWVAQRSAETEAAPCIGQISAIARASGSEREAGRGWHNELSPTRQAASASRRPVRSPLVLGSPSIPLGGQVLSHIGHAGAWDQRSRQETPDRVRSTRPAARHRRGCTLPDGPRPAAVSWRWLLERRRKRSRAYAELAVAGSARMSLTD
jgi:hypothetical protein